MELPNNGDIITIDHSSNFDGGTFDECCKRIPSTSKLHLLMTNEAMPSAFKVPEDVVLLRADVPVGGNHLRLRYLKKDHTARQGSFNTMIILCECVSFTRLRKGFGIPDMRTDTAMDISA
eukprot:TRINITY_DN4287_c0_g1_i2.p2 TRINITY_DN4287_c0_g1~~TRINITY_DN4287_c0_g1_i2.p2  ORF type:complete len:120 (-),score=26.23 TRINITY_DN4287_c0_g1_i2:467-826(-)